MVYRKLFLQRMVQFLQESVVSTLGPHQVRRQGRFSRAQEPQVQVAYGFLLAKGYCWRIGLGVKRLFSEAS